MSKTNKYLNLTPQNCILVLLLITGLWYLTMGTVNESKPKESYGEILGSIGGYAEVIAECVDNCDRIDTFGSKRVCAFNCEKEVEAMKKMNIPPESVKVNYKADDCSVSCKNVSEQYKKGCMSNCVSNKERRDWCQKTACPYSKDPEKCMPICEARHFSAQSNWNWTARS